MRTPTTSLRTPARPRRLAALVAVAAGLAAGLVAPAAHAADQALVQWGDSLDYPAFNPTPAVLPGADPSTITAASVANDKRTFVVTPEGLYASGFPGGLGLGDDSEQRPTLVPVPGTAGATAVAANDDGVLVRKSDGHVLAFGRNEYLTAGVAGGEPVATPTQVAGLSDVEAIAAGRRYGLALKQDGTVWAWGYRDNLGSSAARDAGDSATPAQVALPDGLKATAIAGGYEHALALLEDGSVASWGVNGWGQLGDGTTTARYESARVTGLPVPGGSPIRSITAGYGTSFALLEDGTFWSWGRNDCGQLGLGNGSVNVAVPTKPNAEESIFFPAYPSFKQLSGGGYTTYGLAQDGKLYAWGYNDVGELGSSALDYPWPYPGPNAENPQTTTEIPQRVGRLKDVPWLATGSGASRQAVLSTPTLQTVEGNSEPSFFSQQVGSLSKVRSQSFRAVGDPTTVTSVRIEGPNAGDFLIVGGVESLDLPRLLGPGSDTLLIDVRFAPGEEGERHATLVVKSADEVARLDLDGFGAPLTGGPQGEKGDAGVGPAGPQGAALVGPPGPKGDVGPAGRNGVVTFSAKKASTTVRRGRTASLAFTLRNATSGRLVATTATATVPKALQAAGRRSIMVAGLRAGKSRTVTLLLKVGKRAKLGRSTVELRIPFGSKSITTSAVVKVTR